jgi:hypothetical protein
MCPVVMIVADVICEQPFQMEFIHRNDVGEDQHLTLGEMRVDPDIQFW